MITIPPHARNGAAVRRRSARTHGCRFDAIDEAPYPKSRRIVRVGATRACYHLVILDPHYPACPLLKGHKLDRRSAAHPASSSRRKQPATCTWTRPWGVRISLQSVPDDVAAARCSWPAREENRGYAVSSSASLAAEHPCSHVLES